MTVAINMCEWNSFKCRAMDFEMYLTCRPCIDFQTCVLLPDTHLSCCGTRKWSHVEGSEISGRSRCSLCL